MSEAGDNIKTQEIGSGRRGPGRPKGAPNKIQAAVRDMVRTALDKAGGEDYLLEQSRANPVAFMSLVGKMIALDVNTHHSGGVRVIHVPFPKTPLDG